MVRRQNKIGKRWREGPGVVLMQDGSSHWVSMHGEVWRASSENLSKVVFAELLGVEIVAPPLGDMRNEIKKRNRKFMYKDISVGLTQPK